MIVFDVGANDGSCFINGWNPLGLNATFSRIADVYAFEPEQSMYDALVRKCAGLPNFHPVRSAVSTFDGEGVLHVCPDNGCSSLKPFKPGVDDAWDVTNAKWDYRRVPGDKAFRSFYYTGTETVPVTTLRTFCLRRGIDHIDFLHIDAQGSDLDVLKSLGDRISIVRAGEMEVAADADKALYTGNHTKEESLDFLRSNGFRIVDVKPNDPFGCESNILFTR